MLKFLDAAAMRTSRRYGHAFQAAWPATVVLTMTCMLAGCSAPPRLLAQRDASDPTAPARPVTYRSTLGPYQSARPADPVPWVKQNERVAPPSASEGGSR